MIFLCRNFERNCAQIFYNPSRANKLIGCPSGYTPPLAAISLKTFVGFPVEFQFANLVKGFANFVKYLKSIFYNGFQFLKPRPFGDIKLVGCILAIVE